MTIKIEDLPEGRNIKNIVFDITFEDGELIDVEKIIKTNSSIIKKEDVPRDIDPGFAVSSDSYSKPLIIETKDDIIEKPIFEDTVTREKRDVPKEMLDFNF